MYTQKLVSCLMFTGQRAQVEGDKMKTKRKKKKVMRRAGNPPLGHLQGGIKAKLLRVSLRAPLEFSLKLLMKNFINLKSLVHGYLVYNEKILSKKVSF